MADNEAYFQAEFPDGPNATHPLLGNKRELQKLMEHFSRLAWKSPDDWQMALPAVIGEALIKMGYFKDASTFTIGTEITDGRGVLTVVTHGPEPHGQQPPSRSEAPSSPDGNNDGIIHHPILGNKREVRKLIEHLTRLAWKSPDDWQKTVPLVIGGALARLGYFQVSPPFTIGATVTDRGSRLNIEWHGPEPHGEPPTGPEPPMPGGF